MWQRGTGDIFARAPRPPDPIVTATSQPLRNTAVFGPPGTGKSTGLIPQIQQAADTRTEAIVIVDPQGPLADDAFSHLVVKHEHRIDLIDITTNRLFGINSFPPSPSRNEYERMLDDDQAIDRLAQIIMRAAGRDLNLNTAILTGLWTRNGIRLIRKQLKEESLLLLPYVLFPNHKIQLRLLRTCTDEQLVEEFQRINAIKRPQDQEYHFGPARRLIMPMFKNPAIQAVHSLKQVNWEQVLEEKRIVIFRSTKRASDSTTAAFFNMIIFLTFQTCFEYHARTGKPLPTTIWADESARLKPGQAEIEYLETSRKSGAAICYVFQAVPRNEEFANFLSGMNRIEIYQQKDIQDAELLATHLAGRLFDEDKAKQVIKTDRVLNRGVKREIIKTGSTQYDKKGDRRGKTESEHVLTTPNLEIVTDERKELADFNHQMRVLMNKLMTVPKFHRFVIEGNSATDRPEPVEKVGESWPSVASKIKNVNAAKERILERPHYQTYLPSKNNDELPMPRSLPGFE